MDFTAPAVLAAAVVAVGFFVWYRRLRSDDVLLAMMQRRRETARITSRAELVDGANHIPVALTLEPMRILYENADLQADLELARIDEVEYGSDLLTGQDHQASVLRLRAHGRAIEFLLDRGAATQWSQVLPPHRVDESGRVHVN